MVDTCSKCEGKFEEKDLQLSHDVPRYLFFDKNDADKYPRHYLCKKCHDIYERKVFGVMTKYLPDDVKKIMIKNALRFSEIYFELDEDFFGSKNEPI